MSGITGIAETFIDVSLGVVGGALTTNGPLEFILHADNFENIIGTSFADEIIGDDGRNQLSGGVGDDVLDGGGDDDILLGGAGNDDLTGGAGIDQLYGGRDDDVLSDVGDVDGDALFGGSGNDELTIEGTGAALLSGGSGNDILRGNGNSELSSGSGADVIYAMTGDKIMDRTTPEDRLFVDDVEIVGNLPTLTPQSVEPGEGENFFWGQKSAGGSFWVNDTLEKSISEYDFAVFFEINDDQSDFDGTFQSVSYTVYIVANPGAKGIVLTDVPNSIHSAISSGTIKNNSVIIEDFRPGDFGLMEKLQQEDFESEDRSSFIAGRNFFYDSQFDNSFYAGMLDRIQVQGETVFSFETEIGTSLPHTGEYLREEALRERLIETQPELLVGQVAETGGALGSAADDLHVGDNQSGLFETLGGLDLVFAGGGDDTVDTGSGADFVVAGAGMDVISGGEGADVLYGDFASLELMPASLAPYFDGTIDGPDPIGVSDTITGGACDDVIYGGTGSDLLHGDSGNDQIFGEEHDDTIFGGEGADTISGGAGDDVIDGGHGLDVISGGEGADSIAGDEGGDILNGGAGNDIIGGGDGNDDLAGDDGHDTVLGGAGQDTIDGGRGDDELTGGLGDDELFGGVGDDLYIYALGDGNDRILDDGPLASRDTDRLILTDIASTDVTYTNVNDNLLIELPDGASITIVGQFDFGNAGIEEIEFSDGVVILVDDLDPQIVLQGTNNDDAIEGDRFNEILQGLDGNDLLLGNDGRDTLDGGAGDDSLDGGLGDDNHFGGDGDDVLVGNIGDDSFDGGAGYDTLDFAYTSDNVSIDLLAGTAIFQSGFTEKVLNLEAVIAGSGNNTLTGTNGDNYLFGSAGDDTLYGLAGEDELRGGDGNDILRGGDGNDVINGDLGDDDHYGGAGDDLLIANIGADTFDGGDGNDILDFTYYSGNAYIDLDLGTAGLAGSWSETVLNIENIIAGSGDNVLTGTFGQNDLRGGGGNDMLIGAGGDDLLEGGAGSDRFVFSDGFGHDTIADFDMATGELIDLSGIAGLTGVSDLTFIENGGSTVVRFDLNGDGALDDDASITLTGRILTSADSDQFIF
ncbi:calcium-binding protein [Rhodophyticola porphyridii]|uniref:calcium-binding protein n=1 Tax=Rhodophyticola porphyridii TaxID=1852017 RepID=UPI0035D12EB5